MSDPDPRVPLSTLYEASIDRTEQDMLCLEAKIDFHVEVCANIAELYLNVKSRPKDDAERLRVKQMMLDAATELGDIRKEYLSTCRTLEALKKYLNRM